MPDRPIPAALSFAHPCVADWFASNFAAPTAAQTQGWPSIVAGRSTLLLAPTGSGKTLAAFLVAINRLMFELDCEQKKTRVLYISPLKALGVDVQRNLRAPLAGIQAAAERSGRPYRMPTIGVRSGDTPPAERARMVRHPPEILITTPESLYLMLTSRAAETLTHVETVIVDEIHTMVASKRGAHLFVSLERLEKHRELDAPLQRIGLSATQRPLDEVARLLGGADVLARGELKPRPVEIVDAGRRKPFELLVEVPVEEMARLQQPTADAVIASYDSTGPSIWHAIHPRLLELIDEHRSTMVFVNSRRSAERLAAALNELAEREIALAHHGSISKEKRAQIEDRLKRGELPAIIATSSLELGIDMGAVDLVIQIEAPPSVASGIQRIGRAGHGVGQVSEGVIFPKYRGDLVACAAVTERMRAGHVEQTFYPRNPLDVLAQQIVAAVSQRPMLADELFNLVRGAAPFAELPRRSFDGVLDMLSGLYPAEQFAGLRARVTWDRITGEIKPRQGAARLAVVSGGTIPDRGLYGVFLATGEGASSKRVGELDEEMVFESRPGDVFLLGASSWRIEEITHDRVMVTPAPGEPGRMPFWRGDSIGRPPEFGRAIGKLIRELQGRKEDDAIAMLESEHALDETAARNLVEYLREQEQATGQLPTDESIVIEKFVDEVGDWRVTVLSPFGARVHAPWAMAIAQRIHDEFGVEADCTWSDDGMVFRLPEADEQPPDELFLPEAERVEELVMRQLAGTAMFAAHFRENAARALLLPRRYPGQRTPLWVQRRKSADLLSVAIDFSDFPIVLETYRECLRDVFDMPALRGLLQECEQGKIAVASVRTRNASPFASSLLFSWVSNFLYEGDTPVAERRAQVLSLDHAQLRELLGEPELRELLDARAIEDTVLRLQRLDPERAVKTIDGLHDLLLHLGDLTVDEVVARVEKGAPAGEWLSRLRSERRAVELTIGGQARFIAAEDAGRFRDALGIVPPDGLPEAFLRPVEHAFDQLIGRYARTHGPFTERDVAQRYGVGVGPVRSALERLAEADRVASGEFLPGGRGMEWCDLEVLRQLKQRSLARLRRQVEPVDTELLGLFIPDWQFVTRPRQGPDGLLTVLEQLQGTAVPFSELEREILPARVRGFKPADLDQLTAAGELTWRGVSAIGAKDGRVAVYLADDVDRIVAPVDEAARATGEMPAKLRALFAARGALFFSELVKATGAFAQDVLRALWEMVWAGELTNDTFTPLRSLYTPPRWRSSRRLQGRRPRRTGPPGSEGRWSPLFHPDDAPNVTATQRTVAQVEQLLARYGILTREAVRSERIPGGFAGLYPVLKSMEEAGRIRRGYFVAGLGATQFAQPGAAERLRALRDSERLRDVIALAATDPGNPYGIVLAWPESKKLRPQRVPGARVVLRGGRLLAYLSRTGKQMQTFLPDTEPDHSEAAAALARYLGELPGRAQRGVLIESIDGVAPHRSDLGPYLEEAGYGSVREGTFKRSPLDDA